MESQIIEEQTKEQALRNIDALFAMDQTPPPSPTVAKEATLDISQNAGTKFPHFPLPPENGSVLAELPIDLLVDFPKDKHRFREYTPQEMADMKESITRHGIVQPPLVRPHPTIDGHYEIIAGHNRRTGAKEIGYTTIPCVIRNMDDDEALLQMINSNLRQRPGLLPSEKAWAYRDMMDALKRQGKRAYSTSCQLGTKLTTEEIGGDEDSARQVSRYIRLTYLTPDLLKKVDEAKLGLTVGETLSYISTSAQQIVDVFFFEQRSLTITQAIANQLREMDNDGRLTAQELETTFLSPHVAPKKLKWTGAMKTVRDKYFDKKTSDDDVANIIDKALQAWFTKERISL